MVEGTWHVGENTVLVNQAANGKQAFVNLNALGNFCFLCLRVGLCLVQGRRSVFVDGVVDCPGAARVLLEGNG